MSDIWPLELENVASKFSTPEVDDLIEKKDDKKVERCFCCREF